MTKSARYLLQGIAFVLMAATLIINAGCASDSYAAKGAAEGAGTGAVAGAVGGMVTALIFGGNVAEAGARGAVYGGTTGAVVGGMAGSNVDQQVAQQEQAQREAQLAKFRKEIGPDAYNGVAALAECKHSVAVANAQEATRSSNKNYALAGLWVELLTEADRRNDAKVNALLPEVVEKDRDVNTLADAEVAMGQALKKLEDVRVEYGLPAACPA